MFYYITDEDYVGLNKKCFIEYKQAEKHAQKFVNKTKDPESSIRVYVCSCDDLAIKPRLAAIVSTFGGVNKL